MLLSIWSLRGDSHNSCRKQEQKVRLPKLREDLPIRRKDENDDSILEIVFNTLKCKDLVILFVLRAVMFAIKSNKVRSVKKTDKQTSYQIQRIASFQKLEIISRVRDEDAPCLMRESSLKVCHVCLSLLCMCIRVTIYLVSMCRCLSVK